MRMPSVISIIWTIFFVVCLPVPSSGNFDLTINLSCPRGVISWCANIFVYEQDDISSHDFIAEKLVCTTDNNTLTVPFGYLNPLGDNLTPAYEIVPMITHNCSTTGEYYCKTWKNYFRIPVWTYNEVVWDFKVDQTQDSFGSCKHPEVAPSEIPFGTPKKKKNCNC